MTNHAEEIKLWINEDWYVPVDQNGYCVGESAEGALGFVIKLSRTKMIDFFTALKIPRLMGDTHRENAYTCELMEQEFSAVAFVENYKTPVPKNNLIGVANLTNFLRGEIRTIPGDSDGHEWHHSIVMVSFEKGQRPRFCLVKHENGNLKFWPRGVDPINFDDFREIEHKSNNWSQTVFIEKNDNSHVGSVFGTADAFNRSAVGTTWYIGLPSVNYTWAPGTLQESISLVRTNTEGKVESMRGEWTVRQHLRLSEQICRALYTLHARKMLHADLRPANIVFEAQPENPTSYKVSDYGSFAQTAPKILARSNDGIGQTMGPVMVGERASAFYAPERRLGREREASDTAVLCPILEGRSSIKIVLGWRSDLIDDFGQPRMDRIDQYINQATPPLSELPDKILREGDRVQLRENIFELIEDEKRIGDKQVLTCAYDYWQIYHGRVAVRISADEELTKIKWFPIPRTIELMKWSVATDLYSLGALLLYSIFRNKVDAGDNGSEIEDQFREMLAYLNSEPYFNAVWPELDWLRYCMENALEGTLDAVSFSGLPFTRYDRHMTEKPNSKEPTNLLEAAEDLTNRLAQTAPGIRRIVDGLEYNLAAFVFIVHFSLCCLHRESHFTESPQERRQKVKRPEWKQELPFCKHRRETPEESIATSNALARLAQIQKVIERGELLAMEPKKRDNIGSFDPRPDVSIRIERDQFKRRIDEDLVPTVDRLQKDLIDKNDVIDANERNINALRSEINHLSQLNTQIVQSLHERDVSYQDEMIKYKSVNALLANIITRIHELVGEKPQRFEGEKLRQIRMLTTKEEDILLKLKDPETNTLSQE